MASADIVFGLPQRPRTAVILGEEVRGFEPSLERIGVRCLDGYDSSAPPPDLAVASQSRLEGAIRLGAPTVIVEGRGGVRRLARAGYTVRRFLPFPDITNAQILLPLSRPLAIRYAIGRGLSANPWKRVRNHFAGSLLSRGLRPPGRSLVSVAMRDPGPPFLVAESERLGVPGDAEWVLFPAGGDVLSRGAFHLFAPGEPEPTWVLKFARVPGYSEIFALDEEGLRLVHSCGGAAAAHAPRLVGTLDFEGLHASLETAALGRSVADYLGSAATRTAKLQAVDRIAKWVLELSLETAVPAERLAGERERIRSEVLPRWAPVGAPRSLVDDLPPVPGVLQHNDLGTWNIVVQPPLADARFTVLDWEAAQRVGMPLWDLWYFLQYALAQLDGVSGLSEHSRAWQEEHAVRLFKGELSASATLFEWTRRVVSACGIAERAVGPLATLGFLHHGLAQSDRERTVGRHAPGVGTIETVAPRLARRWLTEPGLGSGWDRWR